MIFRTQDLSVAIRRSLQPEQPEQKGKQYDKSPFPQSLAEQFGGSNARLAVRSIAASCRGRSMACHGMPPLSCAGSGVGG